MKSEKGLTIIEIIITVFILSVAIIGIYSAFSVMATLTSDIFDTFVAASLAQEGVEVIRSVRDNNWLSGVSWYDGLSGCDAGCEIDYKAGTPLGVKPNQHLYGSVGDYLNINSNGMYSYEITNSTKTKFKRKVTIIFLPTSTEPIAEVSVQVYWDQKPTLLNPTGAPGSISVTEYLYNWY
jgi:hypothetical protein